ncbi:MAG: ABC transporter ATP-binding protein [Deltaproteobacteria bacterium]|nr:ABC transporter ATP-binding protein [Deltaproteobacteria bacterium]
MISVENVSKFYGSFQALDKISFEVGKGEVVGFLGPNGAGKTTTLNVLTCNSYPHSGTVKIKGNDVMKNQKLVQKNIGYLAESAPLYNDMLVGEYLEFMGRARFIKGKKLKKRIKEVAAECGIENMLYRPIAHLSKGYRQRVGLAQALLHEPQVLILDEPYTGLDPRQIIEIRKLIKQYGKEHTIILSSHILQEVEATCNRVLIIDRGRIVADGSVEKLLKHNTVVARVAGPPAQISAKISKIQDIEIISEQSWDNDKEQGLEFRIKSVEFDLDEMKAKIYEICRKKDWVLYDLSKGSVTFEDLFISFTSKDKAKEE